jgi:hypothetical protein
MPLRDHELLCPPIIDLLRGDRRPAWEIEDELAKLFNVSPGERALLHPVSGCPVWTNDVAFALKRLVEARKIGREKRKRRAPNGGLRGVYFLTTEAAQQLSKSQASRTAAPALQRRPLEIDRMSRADRALEAFIDESIHRAQARGYNPRVFIEMRATHGTVAAIEKLVRSSDIQSGLRRLHELGLTRCSVEAAVLEFPSRFTLETRKRAGARLTSIKNAVL